MVVVSPTSRWDFVHKQTTSMVRQCAALATERLALKMMSRCAKGMVETPRRRVRQKAGLNRERFSWPGLAWRMRCSACWELVPKTLAERMHVCPHCVHVMPRDRNSALVVLIDAHYTQDAPGTGAAARSKPQSRQRGKSRSVTRETPATTPCV